MSFRSPELRVLIAGLAGATVGLFGLAVLAPASDAMVGSYYQSLVNSGKSKNAAAKATKRAMKGDKGFYGFKLKSGEIPSKSGTLIWGKKAKSVRKGVRTDVVLYSSRSILDKKIPVSGTVMVPTGKAPSGGWPVISWAHGTVGLADQCAPSRSLGKTGNYETESGRLISGWLDSGYAVVATDYEGLGTPGLHPYLVGDSEGRGALDIVNAARQLNPKISKEVVLTGHSQGGQAILFAAKLANLGVGKGSSYLGTVSYAPASNLVAQANSLNQPGFDGAWGISALALSIVKGMTQANPKIKPEALITPSALPIYKKVPSKCLDELTAMATAESLNPKDLFVAGWESTAQGRLILDALGKQNPAVKVGSPVLVTQGTADTTVNPTLTAALVNELRRDNPSLISYETFPGATHSSVLLDSVEKVDPFIAGLFGG